MSPCRGQCSNPVCRYPPTEEVFFVQNAGAAAAGTGLNKSNIVQKISLDVAQTFANDTNSTAEVDVVTVTPDPNIINSNGKIWLD
jgi:gluconolactonase